MSTILIKFREIKMISILQTIFYNNLKMFYQRNNFLKICGIMSSTSRSDGNCIAEDTDSKWPLGRRVQYKFHPETEMVFNQQINTEFQTFYTYLSMAAYFGRNDVALPGCESLFVQMHKEEYQHVQQFLNYVKMRGGAVKLFPLQSPTDQDWQCPINVFKMALDMEIKVTDKLVAANKIAEKYGDLSASDFIITGFMENQMKCINELAKFVTILSGIGDKGLARFLFDKALLANQSDQCKQQ